MKIKTLDIYGYGKWVNQKFDISDGLQLFYGQNEAGKSTLQSFIRSMLFGFPTKRRRVNQLNRYEPRHGEVYGGRLLLTDTSFGSIWIERTNKIFTVTTEEGERLPDNTLEKVLGGLDETLFDNFYAFNLQNLQELSNIDADKISDYFLSIGALGSDKFLAIAKEYEKETDGLYRKQAQNRPLNHMLSEFESLAENIQRMETNMARYDSLIEQQAHQETIIRNLNQEINRLDLEIREKDKLVGRYDIYLKDRAAKRELEQLVYTEIPEKGIELLEVNRKRIEDSNTAIIQNEERLRNLQGELGTLTRLNWANNHVDERRKWIVETQKTKEAQAKFEQTVERIQEQNETMLQLARRGQFYPEKISQDLEYNEKVEEGLAIQSQLDDLEKHQEAVKAERKVYIDQRKEQQNFSAIVRQQVAKLENQRLNEEAQLMQSTSLNHYFLGFIFLLVGIVVVMINFFSSEGGPSIYTWLGLAIAVLGFLSITYIFMEHRKHHAAFKNSPIIEKITELRKKEVQYHEQSKALGTEINERESALEAITAEIENVLTQQKRWLVAIGFYPTADPEIILKTNPVKQYFEAKTQRAHFEAEREALSEKISKWRSEIQPLLERFPLVDDSTRSLIRHVEEVEVALARSQERGKAIQERMEQSRELIEKNKVLIKESEAIISKLFKETDSENELVFRHKVSTNRLIEDLQEKRTLYKDQMQGFEEALAEVETKQALQEEFQSLEQELILTKERLTPHHNERANLIVEINLLEQDGTYQEQVQLMESKKEELRESIYEWGRKRVAMELIYQTLRHGMDNPVPEMNQQADEIFSTLTYGRYTQIKLNKTGLKVKQFSDILFEPHELSQGTLEQLYVALRLAFVENALKMINMPILIDDAFVNFDEIRKTSMYQVLERFSEKHQVLFFTFDLQAKESFAEQQRIDLDEIDHTVENIENSNEKDSEESEKLQIELED